MNGTTCSTCVYFKQHYGLNGSKFFRIYCGHCAFQRVKSKRPDARSCENYVQKAPDENEFASKEYLSKRLLEYILKLELLPEIKGETTQDEEGES